MHCACHDWTRQGTEGFLGHKVCQGPDTWLQSEASRGGLDPDGCLVRCHKAIDITTVEDTGARELASRARDARRHTLAKKAKGYVRGRFSLLTDTMKGQVDA
jgi:hypothetical protein